MPDPNTPALTQFLTSASRSAIRDANGSVITHAQRSGKPGQHDSGAADIRNVNFTDAHSRL
ncbi:hypothetical protein, partial [Sphingomonas beigongshangi]|uniref:hypothetical protein n=1 Tax=Sphingomonas beigongshangi TaxID=2782540 RepID=UPI001EEDE77F